MITFDVEWVSGSKILPIHKKFPIRQVYVWIHEDPDGVIIVSKDGTHWQLPGGKPNKGESALQTAVREVYEETGIDIHTEQDSLHFFGYRVVTEKNAGKKATVYLQLRYRLRIARRHLRLSVEQEDRQQPVDDSIKYVERVSVEEACRRMSWLKDSDEYRAFKALSL